jgi:predicted nucleic acid-binding protein
LNFVLDTNAVSETEKPLPNHGFMAWYRVQDPARLFVSTITLAEEWRGFHSLPPNHQDYERIKRIANDLPRKYRVLNFDARAAVMWGELSAQTQGPLPLRDSFIAAVARSRGYRVVTRDVSPFERLGCKVIAPWK